MDLTHTENLIRSLSKTDLRDINIKKETNNVVVYTSRDKKALNEFADYLKNNDVLVSDIKSDSNDHQIYTSKNNNIKNIKKGIEQKTLGKDFKLMFFNKNIDDIYLSELKKNKIDYMDYINVLNKINKYDEIVDILKNIIIVVLSLFLESILSLAFYFLLTNTPLFKHETDVTISILLLLLFIFIDFKYNSKKKMFFHNLKIIQFFKSNYISLVHSFIKKDNKFISKMKKEQINNKKLYIKKAFSDEKMLKCFNFIESYLRDNLKNDPKLKSNYDLEKVSRFNPKLPNFINYFIDNKIYEFL